MTRKNISMAIMQFTCSIPLKHGIINCSDQNFSFKISWLAPACIGLLNDNPVRRTCLQKTARYCLRKFHWTNQDASILMAHIPVYSATTCKYRFLRDVRAFRGELDTDQGSHWQTSITTQEAYCREIIKEWNLTWASRFTHFVLYAENWSI